MKKTLLMSCGVLFAACVIAGAKVVDKIVAKVNGEAIFLSEYDKNCKAVIDTQKRMVAPKDQNDAWEKEQRKAVLEQMIDDKILLQESKKRNIKVNKRDMDDGMKQIKDRFKRDAEGNTVSDADADKAFKEELKRESLSEKAFEDRVREQLGVVKLIDQEVKARVNQPAGQELTDVFDKVNQLMEGKKLKDASSDEQAQLETLAQYFSQYTAEKVRARHILIKADKGASMKEKTDARKRITDIQAKIKAGEDFGELAKKHSDDKESAARGGDLGYFIKGWMVPEFEKAAFALPVGGVSGIVETEFGYHIIKVEEKKAGQKIKFDDVKNELTEFVFRVKAKKRYDLWLESLKKSTTVEILDSGAK